MRQLPIVLVVLFLAAPASAHNPPGPVLTCQDQPGEGAYHDYLPPAFSSLLIAGQGNTQDCTGDGVPDLEDDDWDYGYGGAILPVVTGDGVSSGALACWGVEGHHGSAIHAWDEIVPGPSFVVLADSTHGIPGSPACGDGIMNPCIVDGDPSRQPSSLPDPAGDAVDLALATVDEVVWNIFGPSGAACNVNDRIYYARGNGANPTLATMPFGAGEDGTYQVFVGPYPTPEVAGAAGMGHLWTTGPFVPQPECADFVDNDGDGRIDHGMDPGCHARDDATESPDPECGDGIDNDGDGRTDHPADPACGSMWDIDEGADPECADGVDNDGDGATDWPADSMCEGMRDGREWPEACQDGIDNDGDGATDYPADPGCYGPHDLQESPEPGCANGVDDDADGDTDWPADPGCDSPRDSEWGETPQCQDGLDNDGDLRIDWPLDPECSHAYDDVEAS